MAAVPQHNRAGAAHRQSRKLHPRHLLRGELNGSGPQTHHIADGSELQQRNALLFGVATQLVFQDPLQHIAAEGQVVKTRQHPQTRHRRFHIPTAAEVGEAAVLIGAAVPVLQRFLLLFHRND